MNMNKIKVGAKIKVNAENPTTAHTLVRWQQYETNKHLRDEITLTPFLNNYSSDFYVKAGLWTEYTIQRP